MKIASILKKKLRMTECELGMNNSVFVLQEKSITMVRDKNKNILKAGSKHRS